MDPEQVPLLTASACKRPQTSAKPLQAALAHTGSQFFKFGSVDMSSTVRLSLLVIECGICMSRAGHTLPVPACPPAVRYICAS